jgi:hypothetical protein
MQFTRIRFASAAGLLLFLTACSQTSSSTSQSATTTSASPSANAAQGAGTSTAASAPVQASPFRTTATIRELMDSTVDPAADGLWDSVAIIYTKKGIEDHRPRTDEEWKAVRRHAITLIESMNLVIMEGRHAALPGTPAGEGELTPDQADQKIAANRAALVQFAHALGDSAQKALDAIDKKDANALLEAGGDIDEACEVCHVTFWYPNQKIPTG